MSDNPVSSFASRKIHCFGVSPFSSLPPIPIHLSRLQSFSFFCAVQHKVLITVFNVAKSGVQHFPTSRKFMYHKGAAVVPRLNGQISRNEIQNLSIVCFLYRHIPVSVPLQVRRIKVSRHCLKTFHRFGAVSCPFFQAHTIFCVSPS